MNQMAFIKDTLRRIEEKLDAFIASQQKKAMTVEERMAKAREAKQTKNNQQSEEITPEVA